MSAASLACALRSVPVSRRVGRRNGTRRAVALSETLPFNAATGGTVTEFVDATGKRRRVHTFTANGNLVKSISFRSYRALVVAGGGPGTINFTGGNRNGYGAGGGAGGMLSNDNLALATGSDPVVVGAPYGNSSFGLIACTRGGAGDASSFAGNAGESGGSGGGGSGDSGGGPGGAGIPGQGNNGGQAPYDGMGGAGGGAGSAASGTTPGAGRFSDISGAPLEYARGGGVGNNVAGRSGYGDGGGGGDPGAGGGQPGGSGVVVVSYQVG